MKDILLYQFLPEQSLVEVESHMINATPVGTTQTYWFKSPEKSDKVIMIFGKVSGGSVSWFQIF